MTSAELKDLLSRLQQELESGQAVAPELRQQLQALDSDIQKVLAQTSGTDAAQAEDDAPLTARAQEIEARFASDHPTLAASLRNMMDALGKMGI